VGGRTCVRRSGSTATVLMFKQEGLMSAWLGDSTAVRLPPRPPHAHGEVKDRNPVLQLSSGRWF
jgi:serine/threonine protein phosphatase PrpC